jgi:uncharacterized protein (TIGR02391 family)
MTVGNSNSDSPGRILETFPVRTICVLVAAVLWAPMAFAQTDPGPRSGPPSAGGPLQGLGPNELAFFTAAQTNFQEVETFKGGLGPRMNLNQCSGCHSQPAVCGSSPATNPQIAFASMLGPPNAIPSFISLNGPVREVRFVTNPNGTPDGGVHDLFVVTPAVGAPATCKLAQPNFAQALKQSNIIFRILLRLAQDQRVANIALSNIETPVWNANSKEYPIQRRVEVARAVAEAWQWLQIEGLLIVSPDQPNGYYCITRKGHRIKTPADAETYFYGNLLPPGMLHPKLAEKIRPMFLRGDYTIAVQQSFIQVEIAVRDAAGLTNDSIGTALMQEAFNPKDGKLTDFDSVMGERVAIMNLFAGAIGHCKNPPSHRRVDTERVSAAQLIAFASHLLSWAEAAGIRRR